MVDLSPTREAQLNEALELLFFAYRQFTAHPDDILAEQGLARVHHRILYFVGRNPGISVNALLGVLGVSKQALNAPLRHLLERGMVASAVGEHDRRSRALTLTDAGAALERELSGSQRTQLAAVFADSGVGSEAAWRDVMRRIAAS